MNTPRLRSVGAAVCVYAVSILGVWTAPPTPNDNPARNPKATPHQAATGPVLRGFALNVHHTDHLNAYLHAIDQIASMGFNSLEITTPVFQTNGQSEQIRIETGPNRGPPRWQLLALLRHAHERQLTTALMPQVLFTEPRNNEWRGKIHPPRWDPWWNSYRRVIDYFLEIANESSVDIFCVGSELLSTERQSDRWIELIHHVRRSFNGRLTYSTNWDHYHVPTVWQHLDMIGISGYWNLSQNAQRDPPAPQDLARQWQRIRQKLLAFAAWHNRPILLTEIGYPSLPWALEDPWNYVQHGDTRPDPAAQAKGYASFLAAWNDLFVDQPDPNRFGGVFFYAWDPHRHGGISDTGYGVRGKPTFDLLRRWLKNDR